MQINTDIENYKEIGLKGTVVELFSDPPIHNINFDTLNLSILLEMKTVQF